MNSELYETFTWTFFVEVYSRCKEWLAATQENFSTAMVKNLVAFTNPATWGTRRPTKEDGDELTSILGRYEPDLRRDSPHLWYDLDRFALSYAIYTMPEFKEIHGDAVEELCDGEEKTKATQESVCINTSDGKTEENGSKDDDNDDDNDDEIIIQKRVMEPFFIFDGGEEDDDEDEEEEHATAIGTSPDNFYSTPLKASDVQHEHEQLPDANDEDDNDDEEEEDDDVYEAPDLLSRTTTTFHYTPRHQERGGKRSHPTPRRLLRNKVIIWKIMIRKQK